MWARCRGAWAQISIEELLVQNPDIILLGDYTWGGVLPEDVAAREGWGGLTAVQNNTVYTFDDNTVSRPGPRLVDGLEAMGKSSTRNYLSSWLSWLVG
ncbi:MAG: ABC transporter substrate-binding protein [Chloroflexi bacterium]|nr:ABC transporter substrate-binding protein [Chloroflexota bacterium]